MRLKLKSINVHMGLSQETYAFTANLFIDGKKAFAVSNAGHGGENEFRCSDASLLADINKYLAEKYPTKDPWAYDLESWISEAVHTFLAVRDFKRCLRTKVLFQKPNDPELYQVKATLAQFIAQKKFAGCVVLSQLPLSAALDIFSPMTFGGNWILD